MVAVMNALMLLLTVFVAQAAETTYGLSKVSSTKSGQSPFQSTDPTIIESTSVLSIEENNHLPKENARQDTKLIKGTVSKSSENLPKSFHQQNPFVSGSPSSQDSKNEQRQFSSPLPHPTVTTVPSISLQKDKYDEVSISQQAYENQQSNFYHPKSEENRQQFENEKYQPQQFFSSPDPTQQRFYSAQDANQEHFYRSHNPNQQHYLRDLEHRRQQFYAPSELNDQQFFDAKRLGNEQQRYFEARQEKQQSSHGKEQSQDDFYRHTDGVLLVGSNVEEGPHSFEYAQDQRQEHDLFKSQERVREHQIMEAQRQYQNEERLRHQQQVYPAPQPSILENQSANSFNKHLQAQKQGDIVPQKQSEQQQFYSGMRMNIQDGQFRGLFNQQGQIIGDKQAIRTQNIVNLSSVNKHDNPLSLPRRTAMQSSMVVTGLKHMPILPALVYKSGPLPTTHAIAYSADPLYKGNAGLRQQLQTPFVRYVYSHIL